MKPLRLCAGGARAPVARQLRSEARASTDSPRTDYKPRAYMYMFFFFFVLLHSNLLLLLQVLNFLKTQSKKVASEKYERCKARDNVCSTAPSHQLADKQANRQTDMCTYTHNKRRYPTACSAAPPNLLHGLHGLHGWCCRHLGGRLDGLQGSGHGD